MNKNQYLTLGQAARKYCRKPLAPSTLWRWATEGLLAKTGRRVRLKYLVEGGTKVTTPEWLDEFREALAEEDQKFFDERREQLSRSDLSASRQVRRSDSAREKELDRIERELERMGA